MPAQKVNMSLRFGRGSLWVDGADISNAVQRAELSFDSNGDRIPRLVLDLAVIEADAEAEGVTYELASATEKALTALGWTPPAS